jgi:hypothetical protein
VEREREREREREEIEYKGTTRSFNSRDGGGDG